MDGMDGVEVSAFGSCFLLECELRLVPTPLRLEKSGEEGVQSRRHRMADGFTGVPGVVFNGGTHVEASIWRD